MSAVPTVTSDTMISPPAPEKCLERDLDLYHLLHPESAQFQQAFVQEVPDDVESTIVTRTNPIQCTHSGPCNAGGGGKRKIKKKFGSKMQFPRDGEDESPLKQIGRGMLTIITTPIAFAGIGIYAVGLIVEGTGTVLKGIGSLGRHVFVSPRPKRSSSTDSIQGNA